MAMGSGSKRARSSESPPMSPARGAPRRRYDNRSLERRTKETEEAPPAAAAEVNKNNNDRVVHEDARGRSIMTLGSDAKTSADRGSQLPRFGEFLKVCGWCNEDILNGTAAYMFGNFNAFCKPECQEKAIIQLYDGHLVESGLPKHPKLGC